MSLLQSVFAQAASWKRNDQVAVSQWLSRPCPGHWKSQGCLTAHCPQLEAAAQPTCDPNRIVCEPGNSSETTISNFLMASSMSRLSALEGRHCFANAKISRWSRPKQKPNIFKHSLHTSPIPKTQLATGPDPPLAFRWGDMKLEWSPPHVARGSNASVLIPSELTPALGGISRPAIEKSTDPNLCAPARHRTALVLFNARGLILSIFCCAGHSKYAWLVPRGPPTVKYRLPAQSPVASTQRPSMCALDSHQAIAPCAVVWCQRQRHARTHRMAQSTLAFQHAGEFTHKSHVGTSYIESLARIRAADYQQSLSLKAITTVGWHSWWQGPPGAPDSSEWTDAVNPDR